MSPAHNLSTFNDITVRFNTSDTNLPSTPKNLKERALSNDETDTAIDYNRQSTKKGELGTIQETKTISDAERSADTAYDEDSGTKMESDRSPILTIEKERLIFSKRNKNENLLELYDVSSDDSTDHKIKKIKYSYSFDLGQVVPIETKKRKYSMETYIPSRGLLKEAVVTKFIDTDFKMQRNFNV